MLIERSFLSTFHPARLLSTFSFGVSGFFLFMLVGIPASFAVAQVRMLSTEPVLDDRELIRAGVKSVTRWHDDDWSDFHRSFDPEGRTVRSCEIWSCSEYRYDGDGNLIEHVYRYWGTDSGEEMVTNYRCTYDRLGRPLRIFRSYEEDRLDEEVIGFYTYDSAGPGRKFWDVEDGAKKLLYSLDSSDGLISNIAVPDRYYGSDYGVFGMELDRVGSFGVEYDDAVAIERRVEEDRVEVVRYDDDGQPLSRRVDRDEPCRYVVEDSCWETTKENERMISYVYRIVIDTCARRAEQFLYSRHRAGSMAIADDGRLVLVQRLESDLDEFGRPLKNRLYEIEKPVRANGTESATAERVERLEETATITYNERGFPVEYVNVDQQTAIRYEYEFFSADRRVKPGIR